MNYTQIENRIFEKIYSMRLTGSQLSILLMIIRYTAGFHRKECEMSYTYIQKGTNLSRSSVRNGVKKLLSIGVVYEAVCPTAGKTRKLGICKEFFLKTEDKQEENKVLENEMIGQAKKDEIRECAIDEATVCGEIKISENSKKDDEFDMNERKTTAIRDEKKAAGAGVNRKENNFRVNLDEGNKGNKEKAARDGVKPEDLYKNEKKPMGIFQNVMLSDGEYKLLKDKYGEKTDGIIDSFSAKLKSKGYSYRDHYATIVLWHIEDEEKEAAEARRAKEKELEKGFDTDEFFNIALNATYKKIHEQERMMSL